MPYPDKSPGPQLHSEAELESKDTVAVELSADKVYLRIFDSEQEEAFCLELNRLEVSTLCSDLLCAQILSRELHDTEEVWGE